MHTCACVCGREAPLGTQATMGVCFYGFTSGTAVAPVGPGTDEGFRHWGVSGAEELNKEGAARGVVDEGVSE